MSKSSDSKPALQDNDRRLPLVRLKSARVVLAGNRVLDEIDWDIFPNQAWVLAGPNGSGKSTLIRMVRGDIWPAQDNGPNQRLYRLNGKTSLAPAGLRSMIGLVSPESQQEYARREWSIPARDVVLSGFFDTPLLYSRPSPEQKAQADRILSELGLSSLAEKPMTALSLGQARLVLLARALAPRPRLLLLDEISHGLDKKARRMVLELCDRIAAKGISLVLASHRLDELPRSIDLALVLEQGRIAAKGRLDQIRTPGRLPITPRPPLYTSGSAAPVQADPLLDLKGCDLFIERKKILKNINWRVLPGQNWLVLGRNGAGKSSLLKLAYGDLAPALGGEVRRFSRAGQGPANPDRLELVRGRIGFVSADLQAAQLHSLNGLETVVSGFFSSIGLFRDPSPEQIERARQTMRFFGLSDLAGVPAASLSYGQMRRILLARAVAPGPELLLLDEPCAGLDPNSRALFLKSLSNLAGQGVCVVLAGHRPEERIPETTHELVLEQGKITYSGPLRRSGE